MKLRGMGVNLQVNEMTSNLDNMRAKLDKVVELGLDVVEIPVQAMNVIRHGRIDETRLRDYIRILESYSLRYTTHAPYHLNLFRDGGSNPTEEALFTASLEVSLAIRAEVMVYHVGRFVGEEEFYYPTLWRAYSEYEKHQLMEMEQSLLFKSGERAQAAGLRIGMENMRPYLDCRDYCYSVVPQALLDQVRNVNHPNVGVTLDFGHLYLAVNMYNLNLEAEVSAIAPHVVHLHVHDNFGVPCFSSEKSQYDLVPLGRGDMHAPMGDGEIPFPAITALLAPYFDGCLVHELRDRYESEWPALRDRYERMTVDRGPVHV